MQTTTTKLTLDRWARLMGLNPIHFWGVDLASLSRTAQQGPQCGEAWFQFGWQDADRVGRDDVAQAIASAEAEIEQLVGYHLLPAWIEDEWTPTVRPYMPERFNLNSRDLRGFQQGIQASRGYVITGGVRAYETLEEDAPIVYDNTIPPAAYANRATVTVTLAEAYADCEIAVYYPGHAGDEQWRIEPIEVSHSGLTYTIRFTRQQALVESFIESYDLAELRGADGLDDDNFLEAVDVGRVYNDPSTQATLLWEPRGDSCDTGNIGDGWDAQTAALLPRNDPRLGLFSYQAANWDAASESFTVVRLPNNRQPDLVRLYYLSGYRDQSKSCPTLEMDDEWARVVAFYAASKLDRPPCGCASARWKYWREDLAFSGGGEQLSSFQITQSDLGNPLGTRRGAVNAWRRIRRPGAVVGRMATG